MQSTMVTRWNKESDAREAVRQGNEHKLDRHIAALKRPLTAPERKCFLQFQAGLSIPAANPFGLHPQDPASPFEMRPEEIEFRCALPLLLCTLQLSAAGDFLDLSTGIMHAAAGQVQVSFRKCTVSDGVRSCAGKCKQIASQRRHGPRPAPPPVSARQGT